MKYLEKYRVKVLIRPVLVLIVACLFVLSGLISTSTKKIEIITPIKPLANWMVENEIDNGIIAAYIDYGPELMYRTDLKVISTPYHRNDSGILFVYKLMNSIDMSYVLDRLKERGVRYILISDAVWEESFYGKSSKETLFNMLRENNAPRFLEEIVLPENLSDYSLFILSDSTKI